MSQSQPSAQIFPTKGQLYYLCPCWGEMGGYGLENQTLLVGIQSLPLLGDPVSHWPLWISDLVWNRDTIIFLTQLCSRLNEITHFSHNPEYQPLWNWQNPREIEWSIPPDLFPELGGRVLYYFSFLKKYFIKLRFNLMTLALINLSPECYPPPLGLPKTVLCSLSHVWNRPNSIIS